MPCISHPISYLCIKLFLAAKQLKDANNYISERGYQAKDDTTLSTSSDCVLNRGPRIRCVPPRLQETDAVSTFKTITPAKRKRCVFLYVQS